MWKLLALSTCLVLAAAVWLIAHDDGTSDQPLVGRQPRELPIRTSIARPAIGARPQLEAPSLSDVGPPPGSAPRAAAEASREVSVAEQRARLQDHFAAESVDPGWASTAGQELSEDLGRLDSKDVRVQSVECRSSLCRAELMATSREGGSLFLQSWLHQRIWTGPGLATVDETNPDGNPRMIMFLGRPGTVLPYLD